MKKFSKAFLLIFILLNGLINPLSAKEIDVTADRMEVYEEEGLAVFTGKVYAKEGDLTLWANKLYIYYEKSLKGREMKKAIAIGQVKIEKGKWKSTSGKATYFKTEERLVLEDQPKVWYENHLVEGDQIVVYFKEDRSEVLSKGGRVRALIRR